MRTISRFVAALALPCAALLAIQPALLAAQEDGAGENGTAVVRGPPPLAVIREGPPQAPPIVQDYEPNPALWKLADEDTTIYLFGTVHALPENFRWRSATLARVIAEADELVVETARSEIEEAAPILFIGPFMRRPDRAPVSSQLSDEARSKWRRLGELMRMPAGMIDRMNPMGLLLRGSQLRGQAPGATAEHGVEAALEPLFLESDRPVISIEEPVATVKSIASLNDEIVIPELEKRLLKWDGQSIESFFLEALAGTKDSEIDWQGIQDRWARGEPLLSEHETLQGTSDFDKAIYETVFVDRNAAWTAWLIERLEQPGTVLLAVGAGHFHGEDSVVAMLDRLGYEAARVQ